MKYWSELSHKTYDTIEELEAAEAILQKEKDERKEDANRVKAASDAVSAAYEAYQKACGEHRKILNDFCKKYGSYKTTVKSSDIRTLDPLFDLLNFLNF